MTTSFAPRSTSAAPISPRLLVVDDEAPLRAAITRYLTREGFLVTEAKSGREALALLDLKTIDVVVSDVNMPELDGVKLLRAVRERDFDVPVVLMTGGPTVASAASAVEHGALAYLVKPFELSKLAEIARRAAALHEIARAKRAAVALSGGETGAADRAGLESVLDRTMESLWIAMQPLVATRDRGLYGYEALMRSDERALPHPGAVLDAAQRLGRLRPLGRIVRERAARAFAGAPNDAALFVNLHAEDLMDPALYDLDSELSALAHRVVLEITERASLDGVKDVRTCIARLRDIGFRIAVDDLGAGYAGLSSFADLEPEIVKLDMSLVRDVDGAPVKRKLIETITRFSHDLGIEVVAEGIETPRERDTLLALGVDYLQGYLLARPGRPFPTHEWGGP